MTKKKELIGMLLDYITAQRRGVAEEYNGISRGFREDAPEEPDVDEEATGDASLIDVEAEKKMAEDASKCRRMF